MLSLPMVDHHIGALLRDCHMICKRHGGNPQRTDIQQILAITRIGIEISNSVMPKGGIEFEDIIAAEPDQIVVVHPYR